MGKRIVYINMGFDPTASLDIVSSLSSGDMLVMVYPSSLEKTSIVRGEQARSQVRSYVDTLRASGREIAYEELEIDLSTLEKAVESLLTSVKRAKEEGYRVSFELSGGTRGGAIIMMLISSWCADYVDEITFIVDTTRVRHTMSTLSPLNINKKFVSRVLAVVASNTSIKRRDLCQSLGVSESSVSRAVSYLKRLGVVEDKLRVISLDERYGTLRPILKTLSERVAEE
ncbi:hypothetical protein HRbin01_01606 [archaeon HR01]|nr:hypothetical protein HRbin01_01606 [archaeon HR01]